MSRNKHSAAGNIFQRTFSLKWTENYNKELTHIWRKIPWPLDKVLVMIAVFAFGISFSGDWLNIFVHILRQFGFIASKPYKNANFQWSLESVRLKDFWIYFFSSNVISFGLYFTVGGFLQWYYYVRRRDHPETWKCQPTRFLTPELERHEFLLGSLTLFFNGTGSSILACYIANGGYSTVYYNLAEFGWTWFFLQFPVIFIYQDYLTYWIHRVLHTPWLYKNFHKLHHKYKQPTVWSVTAIHPVESCFIQSVLVTPLFLFPVHWLPFYCTALYLYYHGMRDHSGINFKSYWWQPWQPDAIFHDNHHQYFHVNFGFNISFWDKLHGTARQKNRVYNEDIFYGKGKSISEATKSEIDEYSEENSAENPLAYRNNNSNHELNEHTEGDQTYGFCLR